MISRRIRRQVARFAAKVLRRDSRIDAIRAANLKFGDAFRALNTEVPEINAKLSANPSPSSVETEALLRRLATNYGQSTTVLQKWADELARLNSIAKGGRK